MSLSSIRLAMAGLRHDYFGKVYVHALRAFVDDSGSGGELPWFVLAGYLGTVEAWDAFDAPWRAILDRPPKLDYFKHSDGYIISSSQFQQVNPGNSLIVLDDTQQSAEGTILAFQPNGWARRHYVTLLSLQHNAKSM